MGVRLDRFHCSILYTSCVLAIDTVCTGLCHQQKYPNSYHHSSYYSIDVTNTVLSDPLVYRLWGQGSRGSLNEEQKLAISGALRSDVYLIQGPPGNNTVMCSIFAG